MAKYLFLPSLAGHNLLYVVNEGKLEKTNQLKPNLMALNVMN